MWQQQCENKSGNIPKPLHVTQPFQDREVSTTNFKLVGYRELWQINTFKSIIRKSVLPLWAVKH